MAAEFKHIVRVVSTDLDGNKKLIDALRKIKGVSFMFANLTCALAGLDKKKLAGEMDEKEIEKINDFLKDPLKFNAPLWMLNRRKDPEEAVDSHLVSTDLKYVQENDIKMMKKIRCYKGIRHMLGQPVRGQCTKAHFRQKGRRALGVKKTSSKKAGK